MEQSFKKGARNKTGALGEKIAHQHLLQSGFELLERNHLKKWGEIDLVMKRKGKVHFVEVKTVSYETKDDLDAAISNGSWRPEENAHPQKMRKVARTAETWIIENKWVGDWQIDVVAVRMVPREKYASVKRIENVVLD